eukprot:4908000-Alexandrium_andersonii.AAC.1
MAGPPRGSRPQARGPFGAPRGPKHLDKLRHSLTSPVQSSPRAEPASKEQHTGSVGCRGRVNVRGAWLLLLCWLGSLGRSKHSREFRAFRAQLGRSGPPPQAASTLASPPLTTLRPVPMNPHEDRQ